MAYQYGTALRNARVTQVHTTIGASATLKIFGAGEPGHPSDADPGTPLVTINLPSPFLTISGGVGTLTGVWSAVAGGSGGTAASFRMYDSGAVCHLQGNVTASGGGGDLTLNNTSISNGQTVTVSSFQITGGNA